MRAVVLSRPDVDRIRTHARETYPFECCGFLLAPPDPKSPEAPRTVVGVRPAPNGVDGDRRRRFVISAGDLLAAEREADAAGLLVVGFYHSHPDHPARPSAFDQAHAWPWYTYLVQSVTPADAPALGAFELDERTATFREVPLEVQSRADQRDRESLRGAEVR